MAGSTLCRFGGSKCFDWKKLFSNEYPDAYKDIVTNSILRNCINDNEYKFLYELATKWNLIDFGVGIGDDENGSIVFYWDGRFSIYTGLNI